MISGLIFNKLFHINILISVILFATKISVYAIILSLLRPD